MLMGLQRSARHEFLHILYFVLFSNSLTSTFVTGQQRQCDQSEIAQFSFDDINGIINFIAEKNCEISDELLENSGDLLNNLDEYGTAFGNDCKMAYFIGKAKGFRNLNLLPMNLRYESHFKKFKIFHPKKIFYHTFLMV